MKYFILGIAFCNFIICIYGQECIWKRYNRDKTLPYVHLGRYIPASESTAYWPSKPSSCSTCIGYKRKSRKASPIAFLYYVEVVRATVFILLTVIMLMRNPPPVHIIMRNCLFMKQQSIYQIKPLKLVEQLS